jgi:hypothetical protein
MQARAPANAWTLTGDERAIARLASGAAMCYARGRRGDYSLG